MALVWNRRRSYMEATKLLINNTHSLVPRLSPRPDENKNGGGEPGNEATIHRVCWDCHFLPKELEYTSMVCVY